MNPDFKSLLFQLQFGDPASQYRALVELKRRGFEEKMLNELKNEGLERKRRMMSQSLSGPSTIKTVAIPTPSFVSDYLGSSLQGRHSQVLTPSKPNFKFSTTVQPPINAAFKGDEVKLMPIAQLGLSIIGSGADITLQVKNYDLLRETFNSGRFIADYKGKKVWKMAFKGNASVRANLVAAEKAAFTKSVKTLKMVKYGGTLTAGLGLYLSYYTAAEQDNNAGWAKFGLDCIMTGVAFIPPFGWVVSGIYGIAGGALDVAGIDWWGSFWAEYLVNSDELLREAVGMFERFDQAHRKVSGVGIYSGSKL